MSIKHPMNKRKLLKLISLCLFFTYLTTYILLSRIGYAQAKQDDAEGFYYFAPADTRQWKILNTACRWLFTPLNQIECWLGWGKPAASDPLFKITANPVNASDGRICHNDLFATFRGYIIALLPLGKASEC